MVATLVAVLTCLPALSAAFECHLDKDHIRYLYNDGEFDSLLQVLQPFAKQNCSTSNADSVFAAKYLGVVYSAYTGYQELGKFYFNILLELEGDSDILDLYVSDGVATAFERVKAEYASRKMRSSVTSTAKHNVASSAPDPAINEPLNSESQNQRIWYWLGGAALIGSGVVTYLFFNHDLPPEETVYKVR